MTTAQITKNDSVKVSNGNVNMGRMVRIFMDEWNESDQTAEASKSIWWERVKLNHLNGAQGVQLKIECLASKIFQDIKDSGGFDFSEVEPSLEGAFNDGLSEIFGVKEDAKRKVWNSIIRNAMFWFFHGAELFAGRGQKDEAESRLSKAVQAGEMIRWGRHYVQNRVDKVHAMLPGSSLNMPKCLVSCAG